MDIGVPLAVYYGPAPMSIKLYRELLAVAHMGIEGSLSWRPGLPNPSYCH